MGVFTMVVTSAVVPIPQDWMSIPRLRIAVSVDGLPEHHDVRRKPATYERILKNIAGRRVNVHWVITKPMMERPGYLEEYVAFWNAQAEVDHVWISLYTPQVDERSPEMLTEKDRERLALELPPLKQRYSKLLMPEGMAEAWIRPPASPQECLFAKMSVNYSADLKTRVEPCVFGGTPDCSQGGCSISSALHWIKAIPVVGPLKIDHLVRASVRIAPGLHASQPVLRSRIAGRLGRNWFEYLCSAERHIVFSLPSRFTFSPMIVKTGGRTCPDFGADPPPIPRG